MKPTLNLPKDIALAQIEAHSAALAAQPDARARLKVARALAFAAASLALGKASLAPDEMERALRALALARANGATNENLGRAIAVSSKRRLEALGLIDAAVLAEARAQIAVNAGCIAMSGASMAPDWFDWREGELLEATNAGRALVVPIGADGSFRVVLRLSAGGEPALKPAEYKAMLDATPVVGIHLPSQTLYLGAPENLLAGARVEVPAPWAKAQLFVLDGARGPRFVAVACPSDGPVPAIAIPATLRI